ncbi:MAG: hypothetical protein FJ098_10480, partial [Deltaproteobacteria bacterium]|nr:hypothetical protein [Deltaproteobacteria bacterium]
FFLPAPAGGIPRQERHLGAVFSTRETAHPEERFREVKWVVERLAEVAGRGELHLELPAAPPALPWITPGRCLAVREAGTGATLGWIGQVNPELCARARLRGTVGFVELDLEPLIEAPPRDRAWRPLPRFPRIARDLSFIVRRDVTHEALAAAARAAAGEHLVELELVALFEGAPIPEGHKSLSYRLTFGAEDRTLRDDEIRPAMDAVVVRVAEATGGHLRDA